MEGINAEKKLTKKQMTERGIQIVKLLQDYQFAPSTVFDSNYPDYPSYQGKMEVMIYLCKIANGEVILNK